MFHARFHKAFAILGCLVLFKTDYHVHASSSLSSSFASREMIGAYHIDNVPGEISSEYTSARKRASLRFKKTQGRDHEIKIYKKGCTEEITNDTTFINGVESSIESTIPNTNDSEFDIVISFNNNIQNTELFTIIDEDVLEEDLSQIEVCVRVDVFYTPDHDPDNKVSVNFKEVEFIWTIRLDTIGAFNIDVDMGSDDYKKFSINPDFVTVKNINDETPKRDEICMRMQTEDPKNPMKISEMEVHWGTSSCEAPLPDDLNITQNLLLNETSGEVLLFGSYKHADLVRSRIFNSRAGGGKVTGLCARIRRHFNPENWELGPGAGQDACTCMDLDITITYSTRDLMLKVEPDILPSKDSDSNEFQDTRDLQEDGFFFTKLGNVTTTYINPFKKEPTPFIASVGLGYDTTSCHCDEDYNCVTDLVLSQGSVMYVCLEVLNTQDVIIGGVSDFVIKQRQESQGNFTYTPINSYARDGLTDVIFQGPKVIVKHQLISALFTDPNPQPLEVSGDMVMSFASTSNPSRGRLLRSDYSRGVEEWKLPSPVDYQASHTTTTVTATTTNSHLYQDNQGKDAPRELVERVLGKRNHWSIDVALTKSSTYGAGPDDTSASAPGKVLTYLVVVTISIVLAVTLVGIVVWRYERRDLDESNSDGDPDNEGGMYA